MAEKLAHGKRDKKGRSDIEADRQIDLQIYKAVEPGIYRPYGWYGPDQGPTDQCKLMHIVCYGASTQASYLFYLSRGAFSKVRVIRPHCRG